MQQLKTDNTLKDVGAAAAVVRHSGRVGVVGYCWGGMLAYLAACELPIACSVVYYGKAANHLDRKPKRPVMYHFGTADKSIPVSDTDKIKAAHPEGLLYLYEGADHGFNCDQRPTYNPAAAALARQRTLDFLARYVAGDAPKND